MTVTKQEYPTRVKRSKKKVTTMYLTQQEKRELIKECGDAALILFEFYLSKAGAPDYQYTDEKSGIALGWSTRKSKDVRLKLTKTGYFYEATARYGDGRHVTTTYLKKETVRDVEEFNHRGDTEEDPNQ